jgi:hypothetical protein
MAVGVAALLLAALPLPACAAEDPASSPSLRIDETPLVRGPVSPTGLQAILGTGDLAVGSNRFAFVLVSPKKLVTTPQATVTSVYYPTEESAGEPQETDTATFWLGPYGVRGLYITQLAFDRTGHWGVEIRLPPEAAQEMVQLSFHVSEEPATPPVGASAPRSRNRTVEDVEGLEQLTTGSLRDPELYQSSIAEAAASGRPSAIVFASPAFCINEVCGPQVEVLQQLKERYRGRANFIHVDLYENPQEIQGDLSQARISPVVEEWGLPSIQWTFLLDRQGRVAGTFEAFATLEELAEALERLL